MSSSWRSPKLHALILKSLTCDSIVSPAFWFRVLNFCLSIVTLVWGLHISRNLLLRHLGSSLDSAGNEDVSILTGLAHFSRIHKRPFMFNGRLVRVSCRDENVIFLFKNLPVFTNVTVKNEWAWSPESVRHVDCSALLPRRLARYSSSSPKNIPEKFFWHHVES